MGIRWLSCHLMVSRLAMTVPNSLWSVRAHVWGVMKLKRTKQDDGRHLGFPFFSWVKFLQIYAKAFTHPRFVRFQTAESNVKFVFWCQIGFHLNLLTLQPATHLRKHVALPWIHNADSSVTGRQSRPWPQWSEPRLVTSIAKLAASSKTQRQKSSTWEETSFNSFLLLTYYLQL